MTDDLIAWILQYESGKAWFNKLNSDVTKRIYLKRLKDYCDSVGKNPDELIRLKLDGLKHVGEPSEYQAENLLETYLATAKLTVDMKVSFKTAIMSFYAKNRRRLESDVAENIERGEPKKRCPKIEDILQLENAMTMQRDKALLWFIASAPIRLGTIPKLKWKDLIPTNDKDVPCYMLIEGARLKGSGKGKYKGVKQVGFLHSLAVEKLKAYRREAKRKGYELNEDSPIFISYRQSGEIRPFASATIEAMYTDASLAAWQDLDAKRFSPHDFRDFVQSSLENAGINVNIIKPLLAHKPKGSDFNYSVHEIMDFMDKFRSALPYLLPQSVEVLKAEAQKTNLLFKEEIETLENRTLELQKKLDEFREWVSSDIEFGHYSKEEKEFLRRKMNLRKYSPEERQRILEFKAWLKELSGEDGFLDEEGAEELKRRIKAKLDKGEWKIRERHSSVDL
jgi:site-specific recombinase XerD